MPTIVHYLYTTCLTAVAV